jgi:hypothetical protein
MGSFLVQRSGFKGSGFKGSGFKGSRFKGSGFKGSGFKDSGLRQLYSAGSSKSNVRVKQSFDLKRQSEAIPEL